MKLLFTITLLLPFSFLFGQEIKYLDSDWNKVDSSTGYAYYKIIERNPTDTNRVKELIYFKSGQIQSEKNYSNHSKNILDGKYNTWYEDGQIKRDINYKDGKWDGKNVTYWKNGKPKRIELYENGKAIEKNCYSSDGKDTTYYEYEIMPKFPGGYDKFVSYLTKELRYPEKSKKDKIEGRVMLRFKIKTDGSISNIKVTKSVNEELDQEAMRVVKKMPNWIPGYQDGEPIFVIFALPITFKLD